MAWRNGKYFYTVKLLKYLSENWDNLYNDGIEFDEEHATRNPFDIAEYRADFEWGLRSLSKRGRCVVNADREGIPDEVMRQRGYWNLKQFRRQGYHRMKLYLNGEE